MLRSGAVIRGARSTTAIAALTFFVTCCPSLRSALAEDGCVGAASLVREGAALGDGSKEEEAKYRDAIASCKKMAEAYHNLAVVLAKQGKIDDAVSQAEAAVKVKDEPRFRVTLASLYLQQGKTDAARDELDRVLKRAPNDVRALQMSSLARARAGDRDGAIEDLKRALSAEDGNALTHFNLAVLLDQKNDLRAALPEYERAASLDSKNFDYQLQLGTAERRLGNVKAALHAFEQAAALKPDDATAAEGSALAYHDLGDLDRAENALRRIVSRSPDDMSAKLNLAVVMVEKKQEALARTLAAEVTEKEPANARGWNVLGWAELRLGDLEKAKASLEKSVSLDASNAAAYKNLSTVLERLGKSSEAEDARRRSEQLSEHVQAVPGT